MSWLVTPIQLTGRPARGSDNSTQSFTQRNSRSSKILSTKGLFVHYYYRVAEKLVFVLSSRCANSLKRTPPPPPQQNVSKINGPTIPFLLLWPTTTPPSVYLESCGEICPRPFLMISVVWKKENGLREEIKLNLTRNQIPTVKLPVLLILNLTGFPK